ncbi:BTAD domain-containing putative transcriptional regulator [Mycolicibacterium arenosum]|uniref:Winged helix-turn-helix domain-containing protein n=1 Tax=Mycolicibacterium arenosum TaxID=2952157 RepID=A0ABT1MAK8_9MYCO|nr:BTAD domain-containing putative transcriptional regulator [Mycolicibacterium sp. CAU 1645]MCP9276211.1 winged helix-turn-helix domain-containing protein [Mycolicibacterium sp. CAU 1645]
MGVSFQLLGEIEARVDGERLVIGHARQACVLACLLVDVNRPVPTDQLIDRVWADEPPHRARNALAAYVSRLRQSLRDLDGVGIIRGSVGYTLTADADAVDLHRFRALALTARAHSDAGEAARTFDEALALWRGEPLAGIDTPWINETRNSIEAERLSVILDRNDAALRAGMHTELVAELVTGLQAHPLDERLAGQLMLAQSRCGRQADALETYRQMRERLVDELGIEPSPTLRAVHQEVLAGSQPPERRVPANIPAPQLISRRGARFVGRTEVLPRITAALESGTALTLTGVGGVGKTRLAFEAADRVQDDYPDGVWSCELAPVSDGAAVSEAVAVALGLAHGRKLAPIEAVLGHLRTRRVLLLIDNCEHVLDDAAALVDRITTECGGVSVLATSREPLGIGLERLLPVEPMPLHEAEQLFAERARGVRPDFDLEAEPIGAVAEICRRLDGVPLAIELAAARLRAMSSLDVARRLDRLRLLTGGARGSHPRQHSVAATIDWSYRLLADREQALFARLSVFAGTFDLEAAHGVCADDGDDEDDTLELLTSLIDKSMVSVFRHAAFTRYALLETLRAYGRERLEERGQDRVYASRHARYFAELFERGSLEVRGPGEQRWIDRMAPTAGTTFTAPDFDNLRTAVGKAMAGDDMDLALRIVVTLPELVHLRVGYHSMDWVERVISLADHDHPLFPAAVGVAARGAWVLGQWTRVREFAELAACRRPPAGTQYLAYPDDSVADMILVEGDAAGALAHYETELRRLQGTGELAREVWVLYNITIGHDFLGAPEDGIPAAEKALRLALPGGSPSTTAMALNAMGRALKSTDHVQALDHLSRAIALATPVQNNFMTGIGRMETAAVHAARGRPAVAARMLREVNDHWSQAGPGPISQHWHAFRYTRDLLYRVGADDDAATLQRAMSSAGYHGGGAAASGGLDTGQSSLSGPETLAFADACLRRLLETPG